MVAEKILCNLSDANEVIKEARDEWIIEALLSLGVSEETIEKGFSDSGDEYEEYLFEMDGHGIDVDTYADGTVVIYKKVWQGGEIGGWLPTDAKQIIGQWKEPKRIQRIEGEESYYEICPNEWRVKL